MPGGVQGTGAFWCAGDLGTGDRRNAAKSGLAAWAPVGDPALGVAALIRGTDRCAAAAARAPGPAVDPGLLAAPLRARGDLTEPFLVAVEQALGKAQERGEVGDFADRAPRIHPAQEQRLRLVDVADTCRLII